MMPDWKALNLIKSCAASKPYPQNMTAPQQSDKNVNVSLIIVPLVTAKTY